jgi:hypothetical protein
MGLGSRRSSQLVCRGSAGSCGGAPQTRGGDAHGSSIGANGVELELASRQHRSVERTGQCQDTGVRRCSCRRRGCLPLPREHPLCRTPHPSVGVVVAPAVINCSDDSCHDAKVSPHDALDGWNIGFDCGLNFGTVGIEHYDGYLSAHRRDPQTQSQPPFRQKSQQPRTTSRSRCGRNSSSRRFPCGRDELSARSDEVDET